MDNGKQNYVNNLKIYHKKLEKGLLQNYKIDTKYLEVLSWGYHTTAIYIKSSDNKEYLLKLADRSEEKEQAIIKDINLSNQLRIVVPTPVYIKTLSNNYTCRFEDKILRLSHYVSGLAPLAITFDILEQMVDVLRKIHDYAWVPQQLEERAVKSGTRSENAAVPARQVLLHGDLTPHNVLVSYGKLVAVMDFEMSFGGPREWDLARTAFFSWNYMKNTSFEQIAHFVLKKYAHDAINPDLFYAYAVENAQKHLNSVEKYQINYDRQEDWEKDRDFAKNQLATLQGLVLFKA